MKRKAQLMLSEDGHSALEQYRQALQQLEDFSLVTIRNYVSGRRQFIAWCEYSWGEGQEDHSFTLQAVASPLLIHYREYLRTSLCLKTSTVNRTLMSLKRYFAWTRNMRLIQADPVSPIKFVPKEATLPRRLSDKKEEALVAVVNATGTLRDQTITPLTLQQIHLGKRNGTLRIVGKRRKVREIPLNTIARSVLSQYVEALPQDCCYLFLSEKTHRALTRWALGHLVTAGKAR